MTFRIADLIRLCNQFDKLAERVLHSESELGEHTEVHLINAYNSVIRYAAKDYTKRKESSKTFITTKVNELRATLKNCARKLNIHIYLPTLLLSPIETTIFPSPKPKPNPKPPIPPAPPAPPIPINHKPNRRDNTNMGDFGYLSNVAQIIKKTYSGEPTGLAAFIEAINLAKRLSQPAQIPTLIDFIKTKCENAAREAIDELPEPPTTVDQITQALRAKIKVENSKVVLGRLLALKSDKTSVQNFQEKGEELAEKLRLAYISDGIPAPVAKTMVIDKTIEMCRSSAKTQLVKSVLASTRFDEPKEVLAKYVVEIANENKEVKEAQVLRFSGNRGRGRGRGRGGRGNYSGYSGYSGYNGQYRNNTGFNYSNSNNFAKNRGGRGRGRGRGGQNYQNDRNNRNGRQVFVVQGNWEAPTQDRGAANDNQGNILTLRQVSQN